MRALPSRPTEEPRQIGYTVAWRNEAGGIARGSVRLEGSELVLRGSGADGTVVGQRVPLDEIASIRIGRADGERVQGTRSVVLELRAGGVMAVAPLGPGEVFELAELLAELSSQRAAGSDLVAVVLPLRRGATERARELVSAGPPFDLERVGLERHSVFITGREVVFLFEGPEAREILEQLVRTPRLLHAAARWRECLAGPPRVAAESYSWHRQRRLSK